MGMGNPRAADGLLAIANAGSPVVVLKGRNIFSQGREPLD
jgi:hypothetical protein